jgi:hydroxymethylpyrimidine/phosphomethylpyrimidine kinase
MPSTDGCSCLEYLMTNPSTPRFPIASDSSDDSTHDEDMASVQVLCFNGNDPTAATGLAADVLSVASVGAYALSVCTGVYVRDTREIQSFAALDSEVVVDQAQAVLQDLQPDVIKIGFLGSTENVAAVAELLSDYEDIPVIGYLPSLSWWDEVSQDTYLDAFAELVLPQTSVLVGNYSVLWRWLLPDWSQVRGPSARELAQAASQYGVPYLVITSVPTDRGHLDNQVATPEAIVCQATVIRHDGEFIGAGETLSAALAALLASGDELAEAVQEALSFVDGSLRAGFRPGMGHVLPDRMFWAQLAEGDEGDEAEPEPTPSGLDDLLALGKTRH